MKPSIPAVLAVSLAVLLAGCAAGPNSYATIQALKSAYLSAGGACAGSSVLDTSSVSSASPILEGMAGVSCSNDIALFVFPSEKARDYMIDLIDGAATASKTGIHMVIGPNWLVGGSGLDNTKFATALGGTARY